LPGKTEIIQKFAWKDRKSLENLLEKSKFCGKIAWKYRNFTDICLEKSTFCWPGSSTPQISKEIDAADVFRFP